MATWGVRRGWFNDHPFADRRETNQAIAAALRAATDDGLEEEPDQLGVIVVPTRAAVRRCAWHLRLAYRGGQHVVAVMAASGLRVAEMVAVRAEDVDLDAMLIRARRQARRDRPWNPAPPGHRTGTGSTGRLKGRQRRVVQVWGVARDDLAWLVEHAVHGWLVPPDAHQRWRLESFNRRLSATCEAAG